MLKNSASQLVTGPFDEARVKEVAAKLRAQLKDNPTFGLVFATPDYAPYYPDFLDLIRLYGHVPTLAGCSASGLVGKNQEQEGGSGFSLILVSVPDAQAEAHVFTAAQVEDYSSPEDWHRITGVKPGGVKAWLVFINPFILNADMWLKQWNQAYPGIPIFGGLASGVPGQDEAWIFQNDQTVSASIAIALTGNISVHTIVSQGCKPIGEPLTVTQSDRNIVLSLGSRKAFEVLDHVYKELTQEERERAGGHLFAGLAMSEYREDYQFGDFLVRNIIGADPKSGAVALAATARVGQTLQYQIRDPLAASEEMNRLLEAKTQEIQSPIYAGLLCCCLGRGKGLFTMANHDATLVGKYFPEVPIAGFFANGEIGPVGTSSYIHAFTASLALIAPGTK